MDVRAEPEACLPGVDWTGAGTGAWGTNKGRTKRVSCGLQTLHGGVGVGSGWRRRQERTESGEHSEATQ